MRSQLTQLALQVAVLVVLHVFALAEEVLVDVSPSEQPHVRVVRDGAVCVVRSVQRCTLGLGLRRRNQERNAEQPQQLLVVKSVMNTKIYKSPKYKKKKVT